MLKFTLIAASFVFAFALTAEAKAPKAQQSFNFGNLQSSLPSFGQGGASLPSFGGGLPTSMPSIPTSLPSAGGNPPAAGNQSVDLSAIQGAITCMMNLIQTQLAQQSASLQACAGQQDPSTCVGQIDQTQLQTELSKCLSGIAGQ